jgi:prepilin peptidase CpaA
MNGLNRAVNLLNESQTVRWLVSLHVPLLLAFVIALTCDHSGIRQPLEWMSLTILALSLGLCTVTDVRSGKIYNVVTYPAMAWALAINAVATILGVWAPGVATGAIGLPSSLLGGLLCFGLMIASFLTAGGGGGDVKLATAIGLLLGPERGLMAIVYTYIAAGAFALVYAATLGAIGAVVWVFAVRLGVVVLPGLAVPPSDESRRVLSRKIRMAPFFALGVLVAVLERGLG